MYINLNIKVAKKIPPSYDSLPYSLYTSQFGLSLLRGQTEVSVHVRGQEGRGLFLLLFKQLHIRIHSMTLPHRTTISMQLIILNTGMTCSSVKKIKLILMQWYVLLRKNRLTAFFSLILHDFFWFYENCLIFNWWYVSGHKTIFPNPKYRNSEENFFNLKNLIYLQ